MSDTGSTTTHTYALPQQRLLLELLNMSGEIAVMGAPDDSLQHPPLDHPAKAIRHRDHGPPRR
jgi:hypothetical protein